MGSDQKRANKPQKPETQPKVRDRQVAREKQVARDKHVARETRPKPSNLDNLQQQVGNRAVQRLVAQREGGEGDYKLDPSTAGRIKRERGGGQALDGAVQREMGQALGQDVSDVRVHTDAEADHLNRQLDARAFTVGRDVFFRDGDYNPHSSDGQELLAHELTHAVDQRAGVVQDGGDGTTVHAPDDAHEQRADDVAKQVTGHQTTGTGKKNSARPSAYVPGKGMATSAVQRQETPEEEIETKAIQRQEIPEEELEVQTLQRQEEPEEEIETKAVQRQENPEEELEIQTLQRQEIPEEELEIQTLQRQEEEEEIQALQRQEEPEEEIETRAIQRQEIPEEELEIQTLQRQEEPEEEIETKR